MRATNTHGNTHCNTHCNMHYSMHSNRLEQVRVLGDKESIKALSLLHTKTTKRNTHAQVRMFEEASDQHQTQLQAKSDEVAMLKKEVCVCCRLFCNWRISKFSRFFTFFPRFSPFLIFRKTVSAVFSRAENAPKQSEITLASRHKTISKEHRVHVFEIYSCTICSLRKFRVLRGDLTWEALRSHRNLLKKVIAMGKCDGIL